jgi:hypothetical protein
VRRVASSVSISQQDRACRDLEIVVVFGLFKGAEMLKMQLKKPPAQRLPARR